MKARVALNQNGDFMKPNKYLVVLSLLNALAFSLTHASANAGQGDKSSNREGQANSHMSSKGSANSNAQWSADPERGWVRADERHQRHDESQATGKSKQNRGKQKSSGAKEKTNN
jgi:hypothetical protein